jgi:hypothetical protein
MDFVIITDLPNIIAKSIIRQMSFNLFLMFWLTIFTGQ